jgi:hypothetical protein
LVARLVDTDIDVEHGETVAREPARLNGNTAAVDWPLCAIRGLRHAAT